MTELSRRENVGAILGEEIAELARIALASLEAEPVAVSDDMAYAFHHALSDSSLGADEVEEIKTGLRAAFANVIAPPAPVSVPAAMNTDDDFDSAFEHGKAVGWNAYRAAMLQGAERVTTAYKLPEGYVLVPVEPTAEMQSAAAGAIRFDTTPINKLWTGNAVYRAMLAAAPQQEVK
ncbi:hypothetical protein SS59_03950 [Enterobacter hormaechei subsp. xiangfangensis]|uniref:Phage protein n=1 Tax=Enterobacter hormaechei subsp. xiangfangensis TaxID=1296536 RepID=A0A837FH94_9ENTR|nr:hypothetical protein SS59_03950 [Enterobacter hormaechei subsp. xiangfangensis]